MKLYRIHYRCKKDGEEWLSKLEWPEDEGWSILCESAIGNPGLELTLVPSEVSPPSQEAPGPWLFQELGGEQGGA